MINQQLLGFIKEQLQKGLSKEIISKQLLGSGWAEQDIEEAYKAIGSISTPTSIPTLNPIPVSNFGSNPINSMSNVSIKEKSHSGKKVFLIVLVLFLLAAGVSAYYFRNDLVRLPIIKDIFPNNNTVVSEMPISETNQEQNLPTQITETPILAEKNCGTVKINPADFFLSDAYLKDSALKCLGESVINNCENAKASIKDNSGFLQNFKIIKNSANICYFDLSYDNSVDIKLSNGQKLGGLNIQCPISIVKGINKVSTKEADFFIPVNKSNPNEYAADIYDYGMIGVFFEGKKDLNNIQNLGCTGSYINAWIQNNKKVVSDSTVKEIKYIIDSTRAEVELYISEKNYQTPEEVSYVGVCKNVLQTAVDKLKKQNIETIKCYDSKDSYAISAPLPGGGFFCASTSATDFNAFNGEIKNQITGPKCQ